MTVRACRVLCAAGLLGLFGCSPLIPLEVASNDGGTPNDAAVVSDGSSLDASAPIDAASTLDAAANNDGSTDAETNVDGGLGCDPSASPFGGGLGSADSPFKLCSAAHLRSISTSTASHFVMTSDIAFAPMGAGSAFTPIPTFEGVFDGAGHTITGLRLGTAGDSAADNLAFVLSLSGAIEHVRFDDVVLNGHSALAVVALSLVDGSGATVNDVQVTNATITISGSSVGGIAGYVGAGTTLSNVLFDGIITANANYPDGVYGAIAHSVVGTVRQAVSSGTLNVTGSAWKTAGIASVAVGGAILEECASHISIDSNGSRVGGVVAVLSGTAEVRDSYANGTLEANEIVGGIAGEVYAATAAKITRVYVAGPLRAVGADASSYPARAIAGHPSSLSGVTVTSAFFDLTATTITAPGAPSGASGRSSGEMKTPATFAAWSQPPWTLTAGNYPRLAFEPVTP